MWPLITTLSTLFLEWPRVWPGFDSDPDYDRLPAERLARSDVETSVMPEFIIRVGSPDGEIGERHVRASTAREAQDELRRQGLQVFDTRRGTFALADVLPRSKRVVTT